MSESFSSKRDLFSAYAPNGSATVNATVNNYGNGPVTAIPGPIYSRLPLLQSVDRSRENVLSSLKASVIEGRRNKGIEGRSRATGLRGMGGLGKTVLASALVHDAEVREAFTYGIVWLTFGQKASALGQFDLLGRAITGLPTGYATVADAAVDLYRLLIDRSLLLVLDDVWEPALIDDFISLPASCHLLITTRIQAVVDRAGADTHEIKFLDLDDSTVLFAKSLGQLDLPNEAKGIIRECGGLPLAINAAVAMVRRSGWAHTQRAFNSVRLESLRTSWLSEGNKENLGNVLAASVHVLPERARACFLACAVWPEDAVVSYDALEIFWSSYIPEQFDRIEVVEELVDAAVLLRADGGSVRLHDLYHDYLRHLVGDKLPSMHATLANSCVRFMGEQVTLIKKSDWVIAFLPWHLAQARRAEQVVSLQFDFAWLQSKLERLGVTKLILDTHLVDDDELRRLGRVLRLSAPTLTRDPAQLAAQLLGRLHDRSNGRIARLCVSAAHHLDSYAIIPRGGKHLNEAGSITSILYNDGASLSGVRLSPDGRRALSWSHDKTLRLWFLDTGESRIIDSDGVISNLLFLANGRRALGWFNSYKNNPNNNLQLWDLESGTGQCLAGHDSRVCGALIMPDQRCALSWSDDNTLRVWDLHSGQAKTLAGHNRVIRGALLLPDGRRAISWSEDHTLRIWNLETGDGRVLEGHESTINGALLLPDGRHAVSWSRDHTLRIWSLESGEGRVLEAQTAEVRGGVPWPYTNSDPSYVKESIQRIWDQETSEGQALKGHKSAVNGAMLLPDGCRLLSWSDDCTLRLWDLDARKVLVLIGHWTHPTEAMLSPNGRHALSWSGPLATPGSSHLLLWDIASGLARCLTGHHSRVEGAVMLPGGERALSWADIDDTLRLWDLETSDGKALKGPGPHIRDVVVSSDGRRALSRSLDGPLCYWDLDDGEGRCWQGHDGRIRGILALSDGIRAISWSDDRNLRLWNLENGQGKLLDHPYSDVKGVALLHDGRHGLCWGRGRNWTLLLIDLENGDGRPMQGHNYLAKLSDHSNYMASKALEIRGLPPPPPPLDSTLGALVLPGGGRALSWGFQDFMLWDLKSCEGLPLVGPKTSISGVALVPDGRRVLSWSRDNTLQIWDLESCKGSFLGSHDSELRDVLALPDGRRALSWSDDRTLHLWDLEAGLRRRLDVCLDVGTKAISLPDGRSVLFWSYQHSMLILNVDTDLARPLRGHCDNVLGALLLPSGREALSWSRDQTLRLWNLESGDCSLVGCHNGAVLGALLLDEGRHAVSWSNDLTLRVWDVQRRCEVKRFFGDAVLTSVTVSEHCPLLLAGDVQGRFMIFEFP